MMILDIPYPDFIKEVQKRVSSLEVYVSKSGESICLSARDDIQNIIVTSSTFEPLESVQSQLKEAKLQVFKGEWRESIEPIRHALLRPFNIVAVSYVSAEDRPGIWVDAAQGMMTPAQALRKVYQEFLETGELNQISFENFVEKAKPNVVILSSDQIEDFLKK